MRFPLSARRSMALAAPPYPDGSAMDVRSRADLRPSAGADKAAAKKKSGRKKAASG